MRHKERRVAMGIDVLAETSSTDRPHAAAAGRDVPRASTRLREGSPQPAHLASSVRRHPRQLPQSPRS